MWATKLSHAEVVLGCGRASSLARPPPDPLMPKTKAKKTAAADITPGAPQTTEARDLHGTTNLSAFGSEAGPSNEPGSGTTSWQEAEDDREPPGKRQAAAGHRTGSELAQTSRVLGGRDDEPPPPTPQPQHQQQQQLTAGGGGGGGDGGGGGGGIAILPDDDLIEVLRWLEVHELPS